MIRIIMMSGAGLAAQNFLDAIESRRSEVFAVGIDATGTHSRFLRYDKTYKAPRATNTEALVERILEIIQLENPHLILPGGDHDVLFLSAFKIKHPDYAHLIPCGSPTIAEVISDKWLSYQFAIKHGLPFVKTYLMKENWQEWQNETFPLLAKPRNGYGSHGVRVIFNEEQLRANDMGGDVVIQEFIGKAPWEGEIEDMFRGGIPWFFSMTEERQYAAQTIIRPDGSWVDPFCSVNKMVMGRCEESEVVREEKLRLIAEKFANAFSNQGWRGSLNVQLKMNEESEFMAHELNGRITGSTSARFLMGYDEIGFLIKAFTSNSIGEGCMETRGAVKKIWRTLTDVIVRTNQ